MAICRAFVFLLCTVGLIAATALAVVLAPRAGDFPFVVIAAIMCVAAITAARNLPLAIIACVAPLARRLASLKRQSEAKVQTRSAVNPFIAVLIVLFLAAGTGILSGVCERPVNIPWARSSLCAGTRCKETS